MARYLEKGDLCRLRHISLPSDMTRAERHKSMFSDICRLGRPRKVSLLIEPVPWASSQVLLGRVRLVSSGVLWVLACTPCLCVLGSPVCFPYLFPLHRSHMASAAEDGRFACRVSATAPRTDIARSTMVCLLYTSPSPRDRQKSRMPSSA